MLKFYFVIPDCPDQTDVNFRRVYLRTNAGVNVLHDGVATSNVNALVDGVFNAIDGSPAAGSQLQNNSYVQYQFDASIQLSDLNRIELLGVALNNKCPQNFDVYIDMGDGALHELTSVRNLQWQYDYQMQSIPVNTALVAWPDILTAQATGTETTASDDTGTETTASDDTGTATTDSIGEVEFVAVVTQSDTGEILKVDPSKTSVLFVNGRIRSYVATVTYKDGLLVSAVPLSNNGNVLNIAPINVVSTVDDKVLVSMLKKEQKIRALTPLEATTVLLKSSSAANYADNFIGKSAAESGYTNLRLAGFNDTAAKQICTHYGVQILARDYLAEEQLQIASSDLSQLTKLLKFLDGKNVNYPDFEQYISALRNDAAVMAVVADAGLKVKR